MFECSCCARELLVFSTFTRAAFDVRLAISCPPLPRLTSLTSIRHTNPSLASPSRRRVTPSTRSIMSSSRCSPSESGRARRVIDGEGRAPVSPTTSQLAQLPSELLTIVLTYLPLPFKFHSVTHLSRHFPQLTASAFQHDHLNLSYPSLLSLSKQWPRSLAPFAQLRSMILLSCDVIVPHRGAQLGPLVTRVLSPSPTVGQPFSALRALSLTLPNNGTLSQNRTLHSVYESFTTGLPLLHTLRVVVSPTPTGYGRPRTGATALVSGWLCRLPSLRRLTIVSMELEARSLLTLFSLPLLSLDLHDSHFSQAPQYDGGYSDEALQAVSGTLRRLALPSGANNTMWAEHVEQLLRRYAERRQPLVEDVKQVEEEKLHVAEPSAVAIQPAWQLRCLRYGHRPAFQWLHFGTAIILTHLNLLQQLPASLRPRLIL